MTAASARGTANRRRGHEAERRLAVYLREQGWPDARRAVVTGSSLAADPGDIAGLPGVIVSVKDCAREAWPAWWAELDAMLAADPAALGIIVHKRRGHADPGVWWAHLRLDDLCSLIDGHRAHDDRSATVRLTVATLVDQLLDGGYGRAVA